MKIPEIPNFGAFEYEDLIGSLVDGACIFYGAGVSRLAGYKLWKELAREIVQRFWMRQKKERLFDPELLTYSLKEYLQKGADEIEIINYMHSINDQVFVEEVRRIFHDDRQRSTDTVYYYLSKLNNGNNVFVTTNIDVGFQNYLGLSDEVVSIVPDFSNPPKLITYLHGNIENEKSWILTGRHYHDNYYREDATCMEFIKYIFANYTVIFIGYGLRDKEILDGIRQIDQKRRHYWLESSYRSKESYLKVRSTSLREDYNIQLVPYLIDCHDQDFLYQVLNGIYIQMANK